MISNTRTATHTPSERLLRRLDEPSTTQVLDRLLDRVDLLLDRLPLLAFAVSAVEGCLQRGEEITENLAESLLEMHQFVSPVDPRHLRETATGLTKMLQAVAAIERAGLLEPRAINRLVDTSRTAADHHDDLRSRPNPPIGLWGIFNALRDPDVQRSLGLVMKLVKRSGQKPAMIE